MPAPGLRHLAPERGARLNLTGSIETLVWTDFGKMSRHAAQQGVHDCGGCAQSCALGRRLLDYLRRVRVAHRSGAAHARPIRVARGSRRAQQPCHFCTQCWHCFVDDVQLPMVNAKGLLIFVPDASCHCAGAGGPIGFFEARGLLASRALPDAYDSCISSVPDGNSFRTHISVNRRCLRADLRRP